MRLSEAISQLERIKNVLKDDPVIAITISVNSNSIGFFPAIFEDPVDRILGDAK